MGCEFASKCTRTAERKRPHVRRATLRSPPVPAPALDRDRTAASTVLRPGPAAWRDAEPAPPGAERRGAAGDAGLRLDGAARSDVLQRDLAVEPPVAAEEVELSADQVRAAIRFNNNRYQADEIRLIQETVGAPVTGEMNEETVQMVAQLQQEFELDVDGMIGNDTFSVLERELTAEGVSDDQCLTLFQAPKWVRGLAFRPGRGVTTRFDMLARFDSRCDCRDFEYRQFICGTVEHVRGGVRTNVSLAGVNNAFGNIPGGQMPACPGFVEDGDTSLPGGTGPNYGHRRQGGAANDRYSPTRRDGCEYHGFDVMGIPGLGAAVPGDQLDFNVRFRGEIHRRVGGRRRRILRRSWSVVDVVTL